MAKSTNAFSEEWDVSSRGFIRRGGSSYRRTCEPAVFPVDPQDLIAYVRTAFFAFECNPGVVAPPPPEGKLPLGCDGFVTATPRKAASTAGRSRRLRASGRAPGRGVGARWTRSTAAR